MRPDELSRRLKLDDIAKNHIWKVEPSCATTGEGIFEGLVRYYILVKFERQWLTTPKAWLGNNVKVPAK
jgi:ADP-ribosylation factor protein 6